MTIAAIPVAGAACSDANRPSAAVDGTTSAGGVLGGPCSPDGTSRTCSVDLGTHGGVHDCFKSTQSCSGGRWGPCADTRGGSITSSFGVGLEASLSYGFAGNVGILSNPPPPPPPSPDSGACAVDPCNPYCQAFTIDAGAGVAPDASVTSDASYSGVIGLGNTPAPVINIGLKDLAHTGTACTGVKDCQFDYYCDIPSGNCVHYVDGQSTPGCAGVNLTLDVACSNGGNVSAPICNRGSVTQPATTYWVEGVAQASLPSIPTSASCPLVGPPTTGSCSVSLPAIPPGKCRSADFSSCAIDFSGATWIFVNAPTKTVTECGEPASPGCSDNWTFFKAPGSPCVPVTPPPTFAPQSFQQTFKSVCPTGFSTQWGFLAFKSTTPCSPGACNGTNSASITFKVQSAPTLPDGGVGSPLPAVPVQVAKAPNAPTGSYTHPAICPMGGPAPCPVDVYAALGGKPAVNYANLILDTTITPTPDTKLTATLLTWELTYSCVPSE